MTTEKKTPNLWQRLLAASEQVSGMQKDTTVSGFGMNYKGISHDSVVRSSRVALHTNGVLAMSSVLNAEEEIFVNAKGKPQHKSSYTVLTTFINVEAPDEREEVLSRGIGIDGQDKSAGKAQSYAKKYGLMFALQMFTADGDETRPDSEYRKSTPKAKPKPEAPRQTPVSDDTWALFQDLRRTAGLSAAEEQKLDRYLTTVQVAGKPVHQRVVKMIAQFEFKQLGKK